jgi:Immunity protein 53
MPEPNLIAKLVEWYSEQCDGEWEHGLGIDLTTVDNPGWMLKVNLRGTALEASHFEPINVIKSENDWLNCHKKQAEFVGAGDPSKLAAILEYFLRFAGKL